MQAKTKEQARRGAIAGAVIAAVMRFVVAIGFVYYVSHWGGQWWGKDGNEPLYLMAIVSGLIGLPVGGLAGWTCKPILGALIGGVLSACFCGVFFVLPAEFMIGMSHPGGFDRVEVFEVIIGFVAMIIAGVVSGALGAAIGARARGGPTTDASA